MAGQSKIGLSRSGGSPKPGPKPIRNGVPLWTETACRFPPKPPAGLNRNRLSETPKFAPDYWKPGRPYLDGIEYTIIPNRSIAILSFIAASST